MHSRSVRNDVSTRRRLLHQPIHQVCKGTAIPCDGFQNTDGHFAFPRPEKWRKGEAERDHFASCHTRAFCSCSCWMAFPTEVGGRYIVSAHPGAPALSATVPLFTFNSRDRRGSLLFQRRHSTEPSNPSDLRSIRLSARLTLYDLLRKTNRLKEYIVCQAKHSALSLGHL